MRNGKTKKQEWVAVCFNKSKFKKKLQGLIGAKIK